MVSDKRADNAIGQSHTDVIGVGACAASGLNSYQVLMGWRAAKAFESTTSFTSARGYRLRLGTVPGIDPALHGARRLVALAAPAFAEAYRDAGAPTTPLPLVLALRDGARGELSAAHARDVLSALAGLAPLDLEHSLLVERGSAGGAQALAAAKALVESRHGPVMVGGVDSFHHPEAIGFLEARGLVGHHTGGSARFGEGAAFLVLAPAETWHARALGRVCTAAVAELPADARALLEEERGLRTRARATAAPGEERSAERAWNDGYRARRMRASLSRLRRDAFGSGAASVRPRPSAWLRAAGSMLPVPEPPPEPEIAATWRELAREALAAWPSLAVRWALGDSNGEQLRSEEWREAARALGPEVRLETPSELLGDAGAATAPLFAAIALRAFQCGAATGHAALVGLASEDGLRGVVLLRASATEEAP